VQIETWCCGADRNLVLSTYHKSGSALSVDDKKSIRSIQITKLPHNQMPFSTNENNSTLPQCDKEVVVGA